MTHRTQISWALASIVVTFAACSGDGPNIDPSGTSTATLPLETADAGADATPPRPVNFTTPRPLIDFGIDTYKGLQGGLYPGGSNAIPAAHLAGGLERARELAPRNAAGAVDAVNGKIVMLTIGMSNTTQEACHHEGVANYLPATCQNWSFIGRWRDDATTNHDKLVIINGARGGMSAENWTSTAGVDPNDPVQSGAYPAPHVPPSCAPYSWHRANLGSDNLYNEEYDRIDACNLERSGYSAQQVQLAWVKLSRADNAATALPAPNADAFNLKRNLANVVRTMKRRYPNLKMVFLSSRVYGGFASGGAASTFSTAEPFAFETGFTVKWLIEAQIRQMNNGGTVVEPSNAPGYAGDLNHATGKAPWLAWGPYLWADGATPNSQGTRWPLSNFSQSLPSYPSDFGQADTVHPNMPGEQQVGGLLLDFFKTSPASRCWFLQGGSCQ